VTASTVVRNDSKPQGSFAPKFVEYPACVELDIDAGFATLRLDLRKADGLAFARYLNDLEAAIVRTLRPQADRLWCALEEISPPARRAMAMADFLSRAACVFRHLDDP
jgi:hypothetical protein